jgi:hypothetical protein
MIQIIEQSLLLSMLWRCLWQESLEAFGYLQEKSPWAAPGHNR